MIKTMHNEPLSICGCGEAGSRPSARPHHAAWMEAGASRWRAFVEANPGLSSVRNEYRVPCLEALERPHRRCKYHARIPVGSIFDHWHMVKSEAGLIAVCQPYHYEPEAAKVLTEARRRGLDLRIVNAGAERSWYFPGDAYLVLIGTSRAIAEVRVDYDVSGCAPIPEGCR